MDQQQTITSLTIGIAVTGEQNISHDYDNSTDFHGDCPIILIGRVVLQGKSNLPQELSN